MAKFGVFVVGGLMARGVAFFELRRKWEKLLKRSDIDIAYFKASQCERGKGEFSKFVADPDNITPTEREKLNSISHEFLGLIPEEGHIILQGIGVVQSEFYEVVKDDNARMILGPDPYRLAYDLAMIQCAWAMKELEKVIVLEKQKVMNTSPSREYVSFVCDEHEKYGPLAREAYRHLKESNPNAAAYMATFSSGDDRDCAVLQAADAVAFEIRRALGLALGQWKGHLRKQFNILADPRKMFLITHTRKEQLLHIVATHKPGEPFKLDSLMDMSLDNNIRFVI